MRSKKVSFFDGSASEERAPLLPTSDPTPKAKDATATVKEETASSSSSSAAVPSGDAVSELEGLSRLLVRSCKVFTVASCVSVLLGSG
eukprot:g5984.t3